MVGNPYANLRARHKNATTDVQAGGNVRSRHMAQAKAAAKSHKHTVHGVAWAIVKHTAKGAAKSVKAVAKHL